MLFMRWRPCWSNNAILLAFGKRSALGESVDGYAFFKIVNSRQSCGLSLQVLCYWSTLRKRKGLPTEPQHVRLPCYMVEDNYLYTQQTYFLKILIRLELFPTKIQKISNNITASTPPTTNIGIKCKRNIKTTAICCAVCHYKN